MENSSIFLAQFWGWYLVIFCVLLIVRPKRMSQLLAYLEDEKYLVLTSLLAIIIGLLNILAHNIWEFNWKLIITLLGWISLTKGIIRFSFPRTALKALNAFNIKWIPYFLVVLFVLGVFLLNQAYIWVPY
ncbi:MAG: hypothetical protein COB01_09240 [Lutibacter sp.]|nr:MAG: hypothetical protein COB01_09240 [Lutibacter sp.]